MALVARLKTKVIAAGLAAVLSDPARYVQRQAHELRRRIRKEEHRVEIFLRHDDPYSLLLLRRLADLTSAYEVTIKLFFIDEEVTANKSPEAELETAYARYDVRQIADLLGDTFADAPAQQFDAGLAAMTALITDEYDFDDAIEIITGAMEAYWMGDEVQLTGLVEPINAMRLEKARQIMSSNSRHLLKSGHYNSAMIHYGGEWYWGVDRLHYLTRRLDQLGIRRTGFATSRDRLDAIMPKLNPRLPEQKRAPTATELEFFFSFRSPYSYIALDRVYFIADRLGLKLTIRPVLPMVKRGVPLSRATRLYIVRDANREARRLGVPFGRIADPLRAAESCIQLSKAAREIGREREFCLAAGRAAWAEGLDLGESGTLTNVALSAGLTRTGIRLALSDESALAEAGENRDRLTAAGLWGVPSFSCGEFSIWGQDRLGALTHFLL